MPQVIITTNAPLAAKQHEELAAEIPIISRGRIFGRAQIIAKRLRIYPAERPGQKYVRTFTLRDALQVIRNDDGYTVTVDPVDKKGKHYGVFPLGSFGVAQAWMHIGRWPAMTAVVDEELADLPREIEDSISAWWDKNAR